MRVKGIIFIAVLVAIGFGLSILLTDSWIEDKIEYNASVANEAKVEIDGFEFDLFSLKIRWDRLQVTNPKNTMMNTFETGDTEFDMDFWPILWSKVIIEDVKLTGFQLDTERETDGYFEMPINESGEPEEPGFISEVTSQISGEIKKNAQSQIDEIKTDIDVDALLAKVDLQSLNKMDSLQTGLQQNYTKWENTLKNNPIEKNVDEIKKNVDGLEVPKLKDPKQAIAALEDVKKLSEQVKKLKTETEQLKKDFDQDFNNSSKSVGQIDNWIKDDIQSAVNVAKLPDFDIQSIGTALFGGNLLGDFNVYLEYIGVARKYGSRFVGGDEEEKIERYKGKNYKFSDKYDWPELWIKNVSLSGKTKTQIDLSGTVTNISNNQKKTGLPIIIDLGGVDKNKVSLSVKGELNYLSDEPKENVTVIYDGFSLKKAKISPSNLLPYELKEGKGEVSAQLDLIDKRIKSEIGYKAKGISFDFEKAGKPKNKIETVIREAIQSTDEVYATALIDGTADKLNIKVRSNIDDLFVNALKNTVKKEVDAAKKKIQDEVERQVTEKRKEVEKIAKEKEAQLRAEYEKLQAKVDEQSKKVEEKKAEIEKKKKELEDAVKDAAKNALKKKIGF
tara:strand:+ start:6771 stop:8621 length:1851 start_codon:yes stop_codon:yes gene_type:complete